MSKSVGVKKKSICGDCVLAALRKHRVRMTVISNRIRVYRKNFDNWYASQSHYGNRQDRESDKELEESTFTVPEIARLLGIEPRNAWFQIVRNPKNHFDMTRVADRPRITKESFEKWYQNQSVYQMIDDTLQGSKRLIDFEQTLTILRKMLDSGNKSISPQEAGKVLNVDTRTLYRQIDYGELQAKKVGKHIRISIVNQTGYLDTSSFIRKFRQQYGCTPVQYRMNNWENETEGI